MSQEQFRLTPNLPGDEGSDAREVEVSESQIVEMQDVPLSVEAVALAERMGRVQAKIEAELKVLEGSSFEWTNLVNAITPTDQASYSALCETVESAKTFLKGAQEFIEPWRVIFYRPYTAVLERSKQIVDGPTAAIKSANQRRIRFEDAVRQAEEREALRLKQEQQQREDDLRLANAITAEELGLSDVAVETLLSQPSVAPSPAVVSTLSRPVGVRKIAANWKAELTDPALFWAWCRKQKEMPACLKIDEPTMNREATTNKANLGNRFPGFRGVNKGGN